MPSRTPRRDLVHVCAHALVHQLPAVAGPRVTGGPPPPTVLDELARSRAMYGKVPYRGDGGSRGAPWVAPSRPSFAYPSPVR
jgi:hypothetical protein